MEKIKAVIFDWGGVLIEDPVPGMVKYCAGILGVGEDKYKQAYRICMDDFQLGRVSERQFWMNMTNILRVPMPKARSLWGEAFAAAYVPRMDLFSLATRLRRRECKIAILSNTEPPSVNFFKKQKYDMFYATVFSCIEGLKKPQKEIYELALARLGTPAGRTLFVDNRREYIDGAQWAGLKTILFKGVNQFKKELIKVIGRIDDGFCNIA
jgi:putative hydrolase of the HAD superfamily